MSDETADHSMICSWADQLALFLRENDRSEQTSTEIEGCEDAAQQEEKPEAPSSGRSRRIEMIENEWNARRMMENFCGLDVGSREPDLQNGISIRYDEVRSLDIVLRFNQ